MPRKRTRDEMEASEPPAAPTESIPLITKIRNMWEFASVMQFIHVFGKAVRIDDDFDIQDFEEECMKPTHSEKLEELGLTLLKWISSFRGLELSNWDEYTRRQYEVKAPQLSPYGTEEDLKHFRDFDIFLKIRVLHQLTIWVFWNPDRIRERMPDPEARHVDWRVEEFGWDRDDRTYYLLDDDRLYRRTEPPLPPLPKAKPKATSKKAQAARRRASKRAKVEKSPSPEPQDEDTLEIDESDTVQDHHSGTPSGSDANTLGGFTWECIAITLAEYQAFIDSIKRTKDPNEQALRDRLIDEVVPVIEAAEEKQRRKMERRERELLAMEKMATAKRSSRIAGKQERDKAEREAQEAERQRAVDLAAAHREQERIEQMENDRQSRMMTREQRIKDREYKRLLAEEELARAAAEEEAIARGEARGSERQVKERLARNKQKLDAIINEDEEWTFDCSGCGVHGKNIDDGSHSLSCERCNVWQHSKCLNISKKDAERDDFHFTCRDCRRKEAEAKKPKISLKFKTGQSSSPPQAARAPSVASPQQANFAGVEVARSSPQQSRPAVNGYHGGSSQYGPRPPSSGQNGYTGQTYSPNPALQRQYPFVMSPYQQGGSPPLQTHPQGYPPLQPGQQWGYPPPPQPFPVNRPSSSGQPYQTYAGNPPPFQYPSQPQLHSATPGARPSSSGSGSRPSSSHGHVNGTTPAAQLPSPVLNRPVMSPSQGNYDVGPVAGIPPYSREGQRSPTFSNGTPAPIGRQPNSSSSPPLSGLSPEKHATPRAQYTPPQAYESSQKQKTQANFSLPPPSAIPIKPVATPSSAAQRTVSGTPIFPPAEKLAPTPEHTNQGPQPTPSKHEVPVPFNSTNRLAASGSSPPRAVTGDVIMNGTSEHEASPALVQPQPLANEPQGQQSSQ